MPFQQGKWLGLALIQEGLCPDYAREIELHIPFDGSVFLRYDVIVRTEDLPKLSRALLSQMPGPKDVGLMAAAGERRHRVTLEDDPDQGTPTTFRPSTLWVAIRPSPPGVGESDHQTHIVEAPYHQQVNTETTLVWGARRLSVMGVQNVDERGIDMVLFCEEVKTP